MDTLNTITLIQGDKLTLAIGKLELLEQKEIQSILNFLSSYNNASLLDIFIHTGLELPKVEKYLNDLYKYNFLLVDLSQLEPCFSLNLFELNKAKLIARKLASFWE